MITLFEHKPKEFQPEDKYYNDLEDYLKDKKSHFFKKKFPFGKQDNYPSIYSLKKDENIISLESSYFIGIDWLVEEANIPFKVLPKLENAQDNYRIDFLKMLTEALTEPDNITHLSGLIHIDTHAKPIVIQQKQDFVTPFILITFLNLLQRIVKLGLKKGYQTKKENFNAKVKGKILISPTFKHNHSHGNYLKTICQHLEFSTNIPENQLLKWAFERCQKLLKQFKEIFTQNLQNAANYIRPAFAKINLIRDKKLLSLSVKPDRFYVEYEQALCLAKVILNHQGFNRPENQSELVSVPPFWIDMSKLFELYVFKLLRQIFKNHHPKVVQHHVKANYQELDFLINYSDDDNNQEYKMVADAKYKPRYNDKKILKEDARQVAGYARLKKIYQKLDIKKINDSYYPLIDCLIIYPNNDTAENTQTNEHTIEIEALKMETFKDYHNIYKLAVSLPITNKN